MNVLIVSREGDTQEVFVSEDVDRLKQHAETLDGAKLSWQDFYGEWGAHANDDEEKVYQIFPAEVVE